MSNEDEQRIRENGLRSGVIWTLREERRAMTYHLGRDLITSLEPTVIPEGTRYSMRMIHAPWTCHERWFHGLVGEVYQGPHEGLIFKC